MSNENSEANCNSYSIAESKSEFDKAWDVIMVILPFLEARNLIIRSKHYYSELYRRGKWHAIALFVVVYC